MERTRSRTPEHLLVSIEEIGNLAVFLPAMVPRLSREANSSTGAAQ